MHLCTNDTVLVKSEYNLLSMSFIFTIIHRIIMFEKITEKIDELLSDQTSASIYICGDFNIHHKKLFVHSIRIDEEGRYCHGFFIILPS